MQTAQNFQKLLLKIKVNMLLFTSILLEYVDIYLLPLKIENYEVFPPETLRFMTDHFLRFIPHQNQFQSSHKIEI